MIGVGTLPIVAFCKGDSYSIISSLIKATIALNYDRLFSCIFKLVMNGNGVGLCMLLEFSRYASQVENIKNSCFEMFSLLKN